MVAEPKDATDAVVKLFELAGYDVSQSVGLVPGTVNWFATRRGGLDRARTYFEVWPECPPRIDSALDQLEEARIDRGADRALAIVMGESLPTAHVPDLDHRLANVISFRQFAIKLASLDEYVRRRVNDLEHQKGIAQYLPRSARTSNGVVVDAATFIEEWVQSGNGQTLLLFGPEGKSTVADVVEYRLGKRFLSNENQTYILADQLKSTSSAVSIALALRAGLAVRRIASPLRAVRWSFPVRHLIIADTLEDAQKLLGSQNADETLELLSLTTEQIEQWVFARISHTSSSGLFGRMWRQLEPFRSLVRGVGDLDAFYEAIQMAMPYATTTWTEGEWVVRVVAEYIKNLLNLTNDDDTTTDDSAIAVAEDIALEQFALGESTILERSYGRIRNARQWYEIERWIRTVRRELPLNNGSQFNNDLIWHYFLARKIAREMKAGTTDLATRYQFPREYVLLFLAVLSPDASARLNADRGEITREHIEQEVERRVELTLAHALNRTIGAISTHISKIHRRLDTETAKSLDYEFRRLNDELEYQRNLVERTRRLHDVPDIEPQAVDVGGHGAGYRSSIC
jgi:hypothetical protein